MKSTNAVSARGVPMEPLLVSAKQITEHRILPFALRTLRRMDASGKMPRAVTIGAKKLWKTADLRQWVEMGCPDRVEFEARMEAESGRT